MTKVVEIKDLYFAYYKGKVQLPIFQSFHLDIKRGDFVTIKGVSGSGKSTLLHLIAGLLKFQKGQIFLSGNPIHQLEDLDLSILRNRHIGFVFQQFYLLPKLTALENILLPTFYPIEERKSDDFKDRIKQLARQLDIEDRLSHRPNELSGGQQQRVAIARALINDPDILLADEPTGNLDSSSTQQILKLLQMLHSQGKTIILITHEEASTQFASQVLTLKDGQLMYTKTNKIHTRVIPSRENTKRDTYSKTNELSQLLKIFKLSLTNAFQNKVRSLLTMLGVAVGVAAICSMTTLGSFTKEKILESYARLGVNTFTFIANYSWPKPTDKVTLRFQSFDWETELLYLKTVISDIHRISPYLTDWGLSAIFAGQSIENTSTLRGISEDGLDIIDRYLLAGDKINAYHVEKKIPVCVIGFEIGKRLFSNISPIGQMLYLSKRDYNTFACQVIGILEDRKSNSSFNPNLEIYIPFTVFQMFSDRYRARITRAIVQVKEGRDIERVGSAVKNFFETKYGNPDIFYIGSDSLLLAHIKKFLSLFSILLAMIALTCLLIGGVGIANMMLVTVSERFKEIGIRKSIGATNLSIRNQFLLESIILCGIAGAVGIVLGICFYQSVIYAATQFIENIEFVWIFDPIALLLSFVSILVVGILSGLFPAMKAEKLQVIDALRNE